MLDNHNNQYKYHYISVMNSIMYEQPIINIGMIGHVSNGKTETTKALTGTSTLKHSKEIKKRYTVNLGYANAKIWQCMQCQAPMCYQATGSSVDMHECKLCNDDCVLVNHVSFVDNPGHNSYMLTMMNGTSVMDYAMLIESGENAIKNVGIPAPQTVEHMRIVEHAGIPVKIVCVNKFDLVPKKQATTIIDSFKKYLATTSIDKTMPIIPISATIGCNIDVLCEMLAKLTPPTRDMERLKMVIVRSFNVNQCRTNIVDLKGGIIGGSIISGSVRIGDKIKIFPGYISQGNTTRWKYMPLDCNVISINTDNTSLAEAYSGGLVGIQLDVDPALMCSNKLVGQIVTDNGQVYETLKLQCKLLGEFQMSVNDRFTVNVNSNNINAFCLNLNDSFDIELQLDNPVCVDIHDKVAISKIVNEQVSVIGYGIVTGGTICQAIQ